MSCEIRTSEPGSPIADQARQVELPAHRDAPVGEIDVRHRGFAHADVDQRDDLLDFGKQRRRKRGRREPRAGGTDRVGGRCCRIDDLDEIQSDLHRVAQVLERDRHLLEGDEHAAGRSIGVGDGVGERLPRPLHRLPERLKLVGFRPAEVRAFELKLARADADVIPLLLLGVEAAEAVDDHRALDGEAERVLRRERKCLAGVDHRGDGDATDGVGHGKSRKCRKTRNYSAGAARNAVGTFWGRAYLPKSRLALKSHPLAREFGYCRECNQEHRIEAGRRRSSFTGGRAGAPVPRNNQGSRVYIGSLFRWR